jgi:hypothetical protein
MSARRFFKTDNNTLYYWETWETDEKSAICHWGIVGETGEHVEHFDSYKKIVKNEIAKKLKEGYEETPDEDFDVMEIIYKIRGMGSDKDEDKIVRLEEKMNELLGWLGLGYCDGFSIGGGTMDVCCVVIDFEIAQNAIADSLKDTEFANYKEIVKLKED